MKEVFYLFFPILITIANLNTEPTTFTIQDNYIMSVGINPNYVEGIDSIPVIEGDNTSLCTALYQMIPENVRNHIEQLGWHYELVPKEKLVELTNQENVIGYTDVENKTVFIQDDVLSIKRAFLHEYGHVVGVSITKDMLINLFNSGVSEEYLDFNTIYNEEKDLFRYTYKSTDGHEISNLAEYLASSFHEYITNPYNLNDKCPKTYVFWTHIIETF